MNPHLKTIKDFLQQNKELGDAEKEALIKSINDADKQWNITEFKLDRTEKVKKTTSILLEETITELEQKRKAVEEQNRELEVEASLERVRTVAMGMNKPDDMVDVCRIIAEQLGILNVKEIRNVQTALFYEEKGTYVNFEYYALHNKSFITEVEYNDHPMTQEFASQMLGGSGGFFSSHLQGKELKDWYEFQKTTKQYLDPHLEVAASLNYYWYSLGSIALGISTYVPLDETGIKLFKRFRNVFELAYRRHIDIEIALAQAKEAKIETALERVRAVAMAMRKPEDLSGIGKTLFTELKTLDFTDLNDTAIVITNEVKQTLTSYLYSDHAGSSFVEAEYKSNPIAQSWINLLKIANDAFVEIKIPEHEMAAWIKNREQVGHKPDPKLHDAKSVYYYSYSIGVGGLSISSFKPVPKEQIKILERFRNVFNLSYQRYIDIAQAEAQAREAQIELALERVRARTMAMQKSEELLDVIAVLGDQLTHLNFKFDNVSFGENNEDYDFKFWLIAAGQSKPLQIQVPYLDNPAPNRVRQAQKSGTKFFADILSKEENRQWTQHIMDHSAIGLLPEKVKHYLLNSDGYARSTFILKNISLYIGNYKAIPYSEEDNNLFYRFAQVFEQSYTRFLDLQKAEAQSREAQIELALERIRARTMAMQRSDELGDVAEILFKQVHELGFKPWAAGFNIWQEGNEAYIDWVTSPSGGFMKPYTVDLTAHPFFREISDAKKRGEDFGAFEVSGESLKESYALLMSFAPEQFGATLSSGITFPDRQINHYVFGGQVGLMFITPDPVPEAHDIFKRLGKVFEQTYTRFLDLQRAEEQTRESQVQLALERVRARTMAMQKSDELSETAVLLFHQLMSLGLDLKGCGFNIWEKDEKICTAWMSGPDGTLSPPFKIPLTEDPFFIRYYESRQKGEDFWVYETSKEELASRYEYFHTLPDLGKMLAKERETAEIELPPFVVDHLVNFSNGNLVFITYQHHPEAHEIFKRFGKVFEQTYTRFLDLKKAEAQARESQVQLALERVRARTMAMQKSDELSEAANLLFQQVQSLGMPAWSAGYCTVDDDKQDITLWMSSAGILQKPFRAPVTKDPSFMHFYNAWERGEKFYVEEIGGDAIVSHYQYMLQLPVVSEMLKQFIADGGSLPTFQIFHLAFFSKGFLLFITYEPVPEAHDVFKRFAKVFEQTYTRFLDLQKAEEQAREAKIEAAMERTRTQSMIMQHSSELDDTLRVFHEQVLSLGIDSAFSFLWLPDEEKDRHLFWAAWAENNSTAFNSKAINYPLDRNEPATAQCLIDWKSNEPVYSYHVPPASVNDYFAVWHELIAGVEQLKPEYFSDGLYYVEAFMKYGCFGIMVKNALSEVEKKILGRFAIEFERTYTRFLDLQKAEAQARESQIELGLERVRARAMAMQNSDELKQLIGTVFIELTKLDLVLTRCVIMIVDIKTNGSTWWMANSEAPSEPIGLFVKYHDYPPNRAYLDAWQGRKLKFQYTLEKKIKKDWDDFLFVETELSLLPDFVIAGMRAPDRVYLNASFNNFGNLTLASLEPLSDEHFNILLRFAKVFDLTYTRFNDLKQAEAQAREARIETALEKVRSRTMAMQRSDELAEVAKSLFQQVKELGITAWTAGFNIWQPDNASYIDWITDPTGEFLEPYTVVIDTHPVFRMIRAARDRGDDFFVSYLDGQEIAEVYQLLNRFGDKGQFQKMLDAGMQFPTKQYNHFVFGAQVSLLFITYEPYPEAWDIYKRFGKVFQQTYTRFLDLQRAEAQALEAIKRASVDRVRAEIASMRTTKDLERITPLIFNELTTLGVPFIRCGVFIMDEEEQKVQTLLSSPDGKAIATLHVPYEFDLSITSNAVNYWRKKKMYKEHWDAKAFIKNWTALSSLRDTSVATAQTEHPPENLYLHLLPFLQGMLYVGNDKPLTEDELQLVQNLADAFSTAYARYEDFNKLEAANVKIEKTLVDLKQTQTQLVQSEKMASLGELTAGIAHEIQNPLNFVNNFSDVNKELLAELTEEIEKGNYEEVKIIANDIINNEEKISHHGKRADSIVKGMLQHSRSTSTSKEPTNINSLADEYLRLAYHGLRAKDKTFNATMKTDYDETIGRVKIIPQDIGRVILNVITNAFYTVNEKKKKKPDGYDPTVSITTKKVGDTVELRVADNGNGIPQKVLDKIFQPFFTTKPTGQGTGLGLSLAYDIVKAHGGEIKVASKDGDGSEFTIQLPLG